MEKSVLKPHFVEVVEQPLEKLVTNNQISPPPLTQKHSGSAQKNLGFIPMLNDEDYTSPNRKLSPAGIRDGINDISIINRTANDTNVSMNTTGIDILTKLHSK